MILSKSELEIKRQECGGPKGVKCNVLSTCEYSKEVKTGTRGSLSVMDNGVYFQVVLGVKLYIPLYELSNVENVNNKLVIYTSDDKYIFRIDKQFDFNKIYNMLRNILGLECEKVSIKQNKSPKQLEKERKKAEFERIMASCPEVEAKPIKSQNDFERDKIKEYDRQGVPYCPKCKSVSIQYVERRKQLSLGRAVVGGALLGGVGAVLGGVTSKKVKGKLKCLKCGYEWKI